MFGDVVHGTLLLVLALSLFRSGSFLPDLQPARHLLLLMSLFSIYSGLVYNDFLSYSLDLFGSCHNRPDCTYPFGVDPVWAYSSNDIAFSNSHKMKQAVILGVL